MLPRRAMKVMKYMLKLGLELLCVVAIVLLIRSNQQGLIPSNNALQPAMDKRGQPQAPNVNPVPPEQSGNNGNQGGLQNNDIQQPLDTLSDYREKGEETDNGRVIDNSNNFGDDFNEPITPNIQTESTRPQPHTDSTFYVVLANGRSGTHLMMHLLNNHPKIKSYGELLQPERILRPQGLLNSNKFRVLKYLTEALCRDKTACGLGKISGFIMLNWELTKLSHLMKLQDILAALDNPRVIILYREMILETFTSLSLVQKTGVPNADTPQNVSVTIDWNRFVTYVKLKRAEWKRSLLALNTREVPKLFMTYEQLSGENQVQAMDRIYNFLGVYPFHGNLTSSIVKLNPKTLDQKIDNWDIISENLKNAPKKLQKLDLAHEDISNIELEDWDFKDFSEKFH
ncbi:unnamed protein product [Owenia fusiformis]|uniref:Uncharacterized protein n=1 Tax=Owenia fusiformis TaxID=6347 RepID=A0A8J1XKE7_OWEFU|nr:unnamed protein product [Owenia fusiformis]